MIYNDSDFTKRGVEASILSIKNDLNRRIGHVQLKYGEIYDAIVAESNGLVDFVNEFRAAVDTIVNECNDLQGLTDEELTEIKQRIEELKEILDSVEIPDLPKIKAPEETFSEPSIDDSGFCSTCVGAQFDCESGFCSIGVGAQVSGSSSLPGKDGGNNATTFGCYEYTVIYGEKGECDKNYVVWGNCNAGDGVCIINYDEELDNHCGRDYTGQYDGCLSKYEDENYKCDGDFMIHMCVNFDSGDSCALGFMSSTTTCDYMYGKGAGSFGQCESNYATCEEYVGDAPTTTCEESYFISISITSCNGYATQDENCPQSYQVAGDMIGCVVDFKDGDTECKTNFGKTDFPQSVSACTGGFKDDSHNCPTNWSYGLGKNACNLNYSDGKITCAKGYITDGVRKWCDNHDAACGRCQLGYCAPANYTPCDYCPSYSPPCSYTPECSEGEPEPCRQEPTCQPCVDITDTCGGDYACSVNCNLAHDDCTGVCNVVRHGSND